MSPRKKQTEASSSKVPIEEKLHISSMEFEKFGLSSEIPPWVSTVDINDVSDQDIKIECGDLRYTSSDTPQLSNTFDAHADVDK